MIDSIQSMASSLDGELLYVFTKPNAPIAVGQKSFVIFNISDYTAIYKLGELLMSYNIVAASTIKLSKDPDFIYVCLESGSSF